MLLKDMGSYAKTKTDTFCFPSSLRESPGHMGLSQGSIGQMGQPGGQMGQQLGGPIGGPIGGPSQAGSFP